MPIVHVSGHFSLRCPLFPGMLPEEHNRADHSDPIIFIVPPDSSSPLGSHVDSIIFLFAHKKAYRKRQNIELLVYIINCISLFKLSYILMCPIII